ncbi:cysteine desulfurase family protein [Klebsiella grimontii]|uniref:cysteine desulfurase family protein n=1 Tax=Klebsiella grimontii TaxID=2058152 RepID=UPI001169023E|nr:cysteine desulfurase family protein [Klebsiella grimontii]VUS40945.1 Cysteine desulfurase IscS [Klebsiella grimontii]
MKRPDNSIPIYLDYNATTPCDTEVVEAMLPYFCEHFGNAASISSRHGWKAHIAVDKAREQLATLINAQSKEIFFTSGATESNNLALRGIWQACRHKGNHIISSTIEHPATLNTLKALEAEGAQVTLLKPRSDGSLDMAELAQSFTADTILVCLMYANNELGVINPVDEIAHLTTKHQVLFMSDATQALGKIGIDVQRCPVDILTCSAHKLYGPKGVGALYIRQKRGQRVVELVPQITGGGGEEGIRAGTLNVPGIVGFGKAAELAKKSLESERLRLQMLRDNFETELAQLAQIKINGIESPRLPHVSNVSFVGVDGTKLTQLLKKSLSVSSGSACSSSSLQPSHVLTAIGLTEDLIEATLRFSFGRPTTADDITLALAEISEGLRKLSVPQTINT